MGGGGRDTFERGIFLTGWPNPTPTFWEDKKNFFLKIYPKGGAIN